ncbi:hypothetical protein SUGI_0419490 [Cryptomeria japonica]|uniref:3-hydroxy-3-methylglutaryl-coenzyme A reductase-like n=1 Tax=Cryptomeria japonica TaxID=3369 RepID=UPI0024089B5C|nr:3-hydroxy-3-methylglutaryl-coenzyme A reductase-like [Cryptomeria japonica]GLJ22296.1 hypothetical protein SUGI_0419490 [Cryptomeria japonica]
MDFSGLGKSKMRVKNGGETDCCGDFKMMKKREFNGNSKLLASDALLLPLGLANKLFFLVFFASSYFLNVVNFGELVAIVAHLASFIYLLGFFGIDYVQNFISCNDDFAEKVDLNIPPTTCGIADKEEIVVKKPEVQLKGINLGDNEDGDIAAAVCNGTVASYSLESSLGDCKRAASVRRRALEIMTGRSLDGLPLEGFDYQSILGQCCEMPVGYVQIPVGVAGPLVVNGSEYMVPMATTEGCLVASTNRGCKAILMSGGATSILLRDGMTRAPVVRFQSAKRASELKFYIEDPANSNNLSDIFNRTSRFARLQDIKCAIAGKNLYMRFSCFTGDAMGMNMVSKGVENVLDYLQNTFPDMDVISVSGNFCADKKPAAVNWIEGRGKSVVCEAIITEAVVNKVLKTTVPALLELNMLKNLTGSAMAGAMGGFNAHAANIVSAVFIATGQDPAQNVESSHCLTMMEGVNGGKDLHISVTMPCIEVGTVGGGTQLASQAACLNMLGVKGANASSPGENAQNLARIVAAAVLAGELSLISALAAGQLVKSHMKYNRSSKDVKAAA